MSSPAFLRGSLSLVFLGSVSLSPRWALSATFFWGSLCPLLFELYETPCFWSFWAAFFEVFEPRVFLITLSLFCLGSLRITSLGIL
jgi:hypothetical protein